MLTSDCVYLILLLLSMVGCFIAEKKGLLQKQLLCGLLVFLPLLITAFHIASADYEACLLPAYIASGIFTLGFAVRKEKQYLSVFVISLLSAVISIVPCQISASYRQPWYSAQFEEIFSLMRRHYVLSDYKAIDWDALYQTYQPQIAALQAEQDDAYYRLLHRFTLEFHDAHVSINKESTLNVKNAYQEFIDGFAYNDPGFSMVQLDDGTVLACNVEEDSDAYRVGLRTGYEVLSIDGQDVHERIAQTEILFAAFADEDNYKFFQPVAAGNIEGTSAEISFTDADGAVVTANIQTIGSYSKRQRRTIRQLLLSTEAAENADSEPKVNYAWRMADADTALLSLEDFMTESNYIASGMDREVFEQYAEEGKLYPGVHILLQRILPEMKASGAKRLILDLRSNSGGDIELPKILLSYLTDEKLFLAAEVYTDADTGETIRTDGVFSEPEENLWGDGDIIILVNAFTVSAAEICTYAMEQLPNVTVMGLTETAGSAMGVSACEIKETVFQFPMYRMIDQNGEILIDSAADWQNQLPLNVKLPFDRDAFEMIFLQDADYALQTALCQRAEH